jgi:hypothetical protein
MQKVLLGIVALLLVGAGVAIGWLASRHFSGPGASPQSDKPAPGTSRQSDKPAVSFRIADPQLVADAPPWETWQYPGSKVDNSSTGGGFSSGDMHFGTTERIALVSPDGFDKVWAFYKDKCQIRDGSSAYRFAGNPSNITLFDDVHANSFAGPKNDALTARAFTVHSLRYQLVGFVYRPRGADSTCILLAYRPNREFISLVKERIVKE